VRVEKKLVSQAKSVNHTRTVRYLHGLEIRTLDDSEELHVIVLPGNVRCLHWVTGQPAAIDNDQLRYSLDDHLGSCSLELDAQGALISLEFYYPFGGTCWWAARSVLEAGYKTIRYSGKEMDACGLYYYGARYYAPWLQRWVSADPAGTVDGPNLYGFVGNNPIGYIDLNGENKDLPLTRYFNNENEKREQRRGPNAHRRARQALANDIGRHAQILGLSKRRALDAQQQILNHLSASEHAMSSARRTAVLLLGQTLSYGLGLGIGIAAQALGAVAPGVGNVMGVGLGFVTKKGVSLLVDYIAERIGASASVKFKASKLSPEKIIQKAEYKTLEPFEYIEQKYKNMNFSSRKGQLKSAKEGVGTGIGLIAKQIVPQGASEISATASTLLSVVEIIHEVSGAGTELSAEKIDKANTHLTNLINEVNANMAGIEERFTAAGITAMKSGDTVESLWQVTNEVTNELKFVQTMLYSKSKKHTAV